MDQNYYGNICYCRKCNGIVHTIKKGDTLYLLSRYYNVPIGEIMNANRNMNVYNLRIGEEICIPVRHMDMMNEQPRMEVESPSAPVETMEVESIPDEPEKPVYLKDVLDDEHMTLKQFKELLEEIS